MSEHIPDVQTVYARSDVQLIYLRYITTCRPRVYTVEDQRAVRTRRLTFELQSLRPQKIALLPGYAHRLEHVTVEHKILSGEQHCSIFSFGK